MWIDGLGENLVRGEIVNRAEAALMRGLIDRRTFTRTVLGAGDSAIAAGCAMADKAIAIQINQASQLANLKSRYDYIVCGAGSSGCVVARRLAERAGARRVGGSSQRARSVPDPQ